MNFSRLQVAVPCRNLLGEGPLWDIANQCLWWLDIYKSRLHRFSPGEQQTHKWELDTPATALSTLSDAKLLLLAGFGQLMLFKPDKNELRPLVELEPDIGTNRPNDGKTDPAGRFWIGTMDNDEQGKTGSLYRVNHDLTITRVLQEQGIPNTFVWSPDHRYFYYADSPEQTIWRFDYDIDTGDISNRQVFVSLRGSNVFPDGSTIDSDGYLWNAQWNGWRVVRYAPDGSVDQVLKMPVACPTSCMFGGESLSTLYITSARKGQSETELSSQQHAGALFSLEAGVKGLPEKNCLLNQQAIRCRS